MHGVQVSLCVYNQHSSTMCMINNMKCPVLRPSPDNTPRVWCVMQSIAGKLTNMS